MVALGSPASPLADLASLRRVDFVMKGGVVVKGPAGALAPAPAQDGGGRGRP
jgi:hypothetical protein